MNCSKKTTQTCSTPKTGKPALKLVTRIAYFGIAAYAFSLSILPDIIHLLGDPTSPWGH